MKIASIDPGNTGALSLYDTNTGRVMGLVDMPVLIVGEKKTTDAVAAAKLLSEWSPDFIILEHVGPRPKRAGGSDEGERRQYSTNLSAEWSLAQGFGALLAVCRLVTEEPATHLVRPDKWKAALGLAAGAGMKSSEKKEMSRQRAMELFPEVSDMLSRKKDHDRAEALLLIEYYRRELLPSGEMEVI